MASSLPRVKELGKAIEVKKSTARWAREADARGLRRRLLEDEKHQLINKRNALILQDSILEARMLRMSGAKQRTAINAAIGRYLANTIKERKKMNLPTAALERGLASRDKITDRIMAFPKSKQSRNVQKGALISMPVSFASGIALAGALDRGFLSGLIAGMGGAGAVNANIVYKKTRSDIRDLRKRLRVQRQKIEDELN